MYTTLKLTFEGKIATLTLSRAEKRNAISHQLIDEFLAALQEVEHSPAQILILAADGKAFCAGMDLEDLHQLVEQTTEENHRHSQRIATLFRSLYEFPKTTIAAVHGVTFGGGFELALLCAELRGLDGRRGLGEIQRGCSQNRYGQNASADHSFSNTFAPSAPPSTGSAVSMTKNKTRTPMIEMAKVAGSCKSFATASI